MTLDQPLRVAVAALCVAGALAGCASSGSAPSANPSGLSGRTQAAVPAPRSAMAEPTPEVPPGPPAKSYAYQGGRDPLTGQATVVEGAPEPLTVDANGDVVQPHAKPAAKSTKSAAKSAMSSKSAARVSDAPGSGIVVQKGDSLYRIARRYRVTVAALMTANGLTSPNIVPGQHLVLPR